MKKVRQKEKIWELLARAVFSSGTISLGIFEEEGFIEAFKRIRPSLELPTRYVLSNRLLDSEFLRVKANIDIKIHEAVFLTLQCDGWSNTRHEGIINFVINTPTPVVYKCLDTKAEKHDAKYIYSEMKKVMDEIGPHKFLAVVTDNAANMKKAWEYLKDDFSEELITTFGCIAHILNLLCGDIIKLQTCQTVESQSKAMVKHIKYSHVLAATLKEKGSKVSLKLPVRTRWGSTLHCFESILQNKQYLQELAISQNVADILNKDFKTRILNDEVYWVRVEKFVEIFKVITRFITILESDAPKISFVAEALKEIETHFLTCLPESPLTKAEEKQLMQSLKQRKEMALSPLHFAANILDCTKLGKDLTPEQNLEGMEYIFKVAAKIRKLYEIQNPGGDKKTIMINENDIIRQLAQYRSKEGYWKSDFLWNMAMSESVTVIQWWKGLCSEMSLSAVAVAILEVPPSSAATERTFSTYSLIHTARRNRLTNKKAAKLVFVKHNLQSIKRAYKEENKPSEKEKVRQETTPEPLAQEKGDRHGVVATLNSDSEKECKERNSDSDSDDVLEEESWNSDTSESETHESLAEMLDSEEQDI